MTEPDEVEGSPEAPGPPRPTRMLRREQQIGYVLAGVAAAGSVFAATAGGLPALGLIGVATSILLLLATWKGHRVLAGGASLVASLAGAVYFVPIEIGLVVFGGYLFWRTSNAQAKLRRAQSPQTAAERREAAAARAAARAEKRRGTKTPAASARTPVASRRYTPPKAKPVRPPQKASKPEP